MECKKKIKTSINNESFHHYVHRFIFNSKEKSLQNYQRQSSQKTSQTHHFKKTYSVHEQDDEKMEDRWVYKLSSKQLMSA